MPKSRYTPEFSVRTPEALAALQTWLGEIERGTAKRGREYFETGQVRSIRAEADHYVTAEVQGSDLYEVDLFLTRGKWTASCTCPVGNDCKHAVAAAWTWLDRKGADLDEQTRGVTAEAVPEKPAAALLPALVPPSAMLPPEPPGQKIPFSKRYTPVIEEKIGRTLTTAEIQQLGRLSGLFQHLRQGWGGLRPGMLRQYGFTSLIPPGATDWEPLFQGWWPPDQLPADPWALWQYLAYSAAQHGQTIPEVFKPMTDTRQVALAVEGAELKKQLAAWTQRLAAMTTATAETPRLIEEGMGLRARLTPDAFLQLEVRAGPDKPWKPPVRKWLAGLVRATPAELETLPPAEAALATTVLLAARRFRGPEDALPTQLDSLVAGEVLATRATHPAIVRPDGSPLTIEAEPLALEAHLSPYNPEHLALQLVEPGGQPAPEALLIAEQPAPLYLHDGRVWRGPPPLPRMPLPVAALGEQTVMRSLRAIGVRVPASLQLHHRVVPMRPRLTCWIAQKEAVSGLQEDWLMLQLTAHSDDPRGEQVYRLDGWHWTKDGAPPLRRAGDPILEFDLAAATEVTKRFPDFRLRGVYGQDMWERPAGRNFPEELIAWHASLPPGVEFAATPEIARIFGGPVRAVVDFSAEAAEGGHDWFDLRVALRVEDTTLTPEEIALLLKARGKWVRLAGKGWQRLAVAEDDATTQAATAALDRLGLSAADVLEQGTTATHRLHALQLAGEAGTFEARDAKVAAALRERAARLAALPPPELPAGLTATLRPYQREGFHFLAHLSAQGFGGVLADDMGLGKTVQTLAWLLHLAEALPEEKRATLRVLVVCPKSVVHGWLGETARFAPGLRAVAFEPMMTLTPPGKLAAPLLVANYTQMRLNGAWFQAETWDAVVLDEGQFIKNAASQSAVVARALPARHRLVVTGTPVENRLTDLWSLFAFAQPGLLGGKTAFNRQYDERDPEARARLHRRVRHFILRRTKAQAAPDLPPRTEDDLVVDLEPAQRRLYDAELKRARAQLLGIETARALDKVRFNVLASLLRLRQICCHPALVDRAHAGLPSAKLDSLLERLEELREEGHQVLVFSQFVEMLRIIAARLDTAGIEHLMLTGATEDRAELVERFQTDRSKTVFLLSLKAAGFGLNLTAASYAILYDPWWNPAVEAQAIDRTHRIGQTRPVIAYRLLAANTVEEKIRALQKEKAALAAAVVQEESLASVLDLESLKRILG